MENFLGYIMNTHFMLTLIILCLVFISTCNCQIQHNVVQELSCVKYRDLTVTNFNVAIHLHAVCV